jgi:hypothetical protein
LTEQTVIPAVRQMTVHEVPSGQSVWDDRRVARAPTVGWFVRQSALWVGIVAIAVVLACGLYAIASTSGTSHARASAKVTAPPIKA